MKKSITNYSLPRKYSLNSHEEYNNEPVFYCRDCLSLKIMTYEDNDFCDSCGSSNIAQMNIKDWENLYLNKYGHKFID